MLWITPILEIGFLQLLAAWGFMGFVRGKDRLGNRTCGLRVAGWCCCGAAFGDLVKRPANRVRSLLRTEAITTKHRANRFEIGRLAQR